MSCEIEPLTNSFGVTWRAGADQRILDLDAGKVRKLYCSSGAVLFRGFKATMSEFVAFSNKFTILLVHPLRVPEGKPNSNTEIVYDVDPDRAGGPRALHAEASDTGIALGMCWFFCEAAPPLGGETTIANGEEVLERLSPATRTLFESKKVSYKYIFSEEEWQIFFQTSDRAIVEMTAKKIGRVESRFRSDGGLDLVHTTPAVVPTRYGQRNAFINAIPEYLRVMRGPAVSQKRAVLFEDESPIPENVDLEIKEICEKCEHAIQWADGDVVMVDNTSLMHGRRTWQLQYPRRVHARFGEANF